MNRHTKPGELPGAGLPEVSAAFSADIFLFFRDALAQYSGVFLDNARQRLLEQSVARRMAATGDTLAAYQRRVGAPQDTVEIARLAELVLNHETMFFRNGPHFQALRQQILPELHARKPAGMPLRIWSAGCSTGEEPYSLAIAALEALGQPLPRPVEILATDLSEPALQKARAGLYRGRTLQNISPEQLDRYFMPAGNSYAVGHAARSLVHFRQLNLLDPFPAIAQGVDVIFCQNVTIYFQLKTCQVLIARFYDCLPVGGLLFLGFSETLWNVFEHFSTREVAGAYVYSKGRTQATQPLQPAPTPQARRNQTGALAQPSARRAPVTAPLPGGRASNATPGADRALLTRGYELLHAGQYDEALEMLRHIPLRSAIVPEALTLIARVHADRGDLDLASAEVQRAIEMDALHHDAYVLLGLIASRQCQWLTAIQQLERARYLNRDAPIISYHLAEAYRQAGRAEKAMQEYRNTLQKLQKHPPGELLDGVAVSWLTETCQRHIESISRSISSKLGA